MFRDTSLMRLIIDELAQKHNWSYEEAIEDFTNLIPADLYPTVQPGHSHTPHRS